DGGTTVSPSLNYSNPISVPTQETVEETDDSIPRAGMSAFDEARKAFKKGSYAKAQSEIETAIKLLPGDTMMHEFRALILFARGKYKDAAGGLYAVLARGPGMDWDTMKGFYDDADTYTKQLRKLEAAVKKNPKRSDYHFLLAYHYLVLEEREAAQEELAT